MSGTDHGQQPPFNDPKHPSWYTEPGAAGNKQVPPSSPEVAPNPYAFQPGPGAQPTPQYNPYGGPGYNQQMYYQPQPQPKGLSIGALVCGIVGVVTFGFLFLPQIAAIVLGHIGLSKEPAGRGMAIGGLVMGYLVAGLWAMLLFFGFIGAASSGF